MEQVALLLWSHDLRCFQAKYTSILSLSPCPPGPTASCTPPEKKWGDTGTAHPLSEILSQIHWSPNKAVTDLCEQPFVLLLAHRKQYKFL